MHRMRVMIAVGIALFAAVGAHGAPSAGTTYMFNCAGSSSPFSNLALVSFNLSVVPPPVSTSGSAITGTFTVLFPANTNAQEMMNAVQKGGHYTTCKLAQTVVVPSGNGGAGSTTVYTYDFSTVFPTALTVIGSSASNTDSEGANLPTALMQAKFEYEFVSVKISN